MTRAGDLLKRFRMAVLPEIRVVALVSDREAAGFQRLDEGKWISGRFPAGIRLDQATHMQGAGPLHAHVYGRKGNELVVVNYDGTASHGSRGILHKDDAAALRSRGFKVRPDRIVEWLIVNNPSELEALFSGR